MRYVIALSTLAGSAFLLTPVSSGQTATGKLVVEGYIRDSVANAGIQGDVNLVHGLNPRIAMNQRTDSRGHYRFEITPTGPITLVAKAPGHVSSARRIQPLGAAPLTVDFALARAIQVSGMLTDPGGTPITGATVRVLYPGDSLVFAFGEELGNIVTDGAGRFALPYVKAQANFVLEVTKPDHLPSFSPAQMSGTAAMKNLTVRVPLRRGALIRGVVEDRTGRPVPGVSLTLGLQPSQVLSQVPAELIGNSIAATQLGRMTVQTSAGGTFTFSGLPAGPAVLVGRKPGYKPSKLNVTVIGDQELAVKLIVEPGA